MIIVEVEQNTEEWIKFKESKVGGSGLKDIVTERGNGVKIGVWKLLSSMITKEETIEDWRARGHELESEAIKLFNEVSDDKIEDHKEVWQSSKNPKIMVSPDGHTKDKKTAAEVKCLSGPYHLDAIIDYHASIEQDELVLSESLPSGFKHQVIQYFIVNEELEELHLIFYNPSVESMPMHVMSFTRGDLQKDIEKYEALENEIIENVDKIANWLTF